MGELRRALEVAEGLSALVTVDLADLDFIDLAALACLREASTRLSCRGGTLTLRGDTGQVARMFELAGTPAGIDRSPGRSRGALVEGGGVTPMPLGGGSAR